MATGETPLATVRRAFAETLHLAVDDTPAADLLLTLAVGNQMTSVTDPLWCWYIGPPGSGKNETLRTFADHATTYFISELTDNALMSGYRDDDNPDFDPSLLPHLNDKTVVIEDISSLLELKETSLNKIMGTLRNLYGDEKQVKSSGSAGARTYHARFGLIIGATPAIDSAMSRHSQLGERFVAFRLGRRAAKRPRSARLISLRQVKAAMTGKSEWRRSLKGVVHEALNRVLTDLLTNGEAVAYTTDIEGLILNLADLVARLRTVPVQGMAVDPETGNRLVQQFHTLGSARALADGRREWTTDDVHFIQRIANDTLPRWVVELLCLLSPVVQADEEPRPTLNFFRDIIPRVTAVSAQILSLYIRQYRHLRILDPIASVGGQGSLRLSEETLAQLYDSGLLYGERGLP